MIAMTEALQNDAVNPYGLESSRAQELVAAATAMGPALRERSARASRTVGGAGLARSRSRTAGSGLQPRAESATRICRPSSRPCALRMRQSETKCCVAGCRPPPERSTRNQPSEPFSEWLTARGLVGGPETMISAPLPSVLPTPQPARTAL